MNLLYKSLVLLVGIIVVYFFSKYTTIDSSKHYFPRGSWDVYIVKQDNSSIDNAEITLSSYKLMVVDKEKSKKKIVFSNQVPFDNFITSNSIFSQTGHFSLVNTRELVSIWKHYKLFWLFHISEGFDPHQEKNCVKLKIAADGYVPKIIDYKDICNSDNPIYIILDDLPERD